MVCSTFRDFQSLTFLTASSHIGRQSVVSRPVGDSGTRGRPLPVSPRCAGALRPAPICHTVTLCRHCPPRTLSMHEAGGGVYAEMFSLARCAVAAHRRAGIVQHVSNHDRSSSVVCPVSVPRQFACMVHCRICLFALVQCPLPACYLSTFCDFVSY